MDMNDIKTTDLVIYYENRSFFWTLSGVVKPSPSMGFRCQVSGFRLNVRVSEKAPLWRRHILMLRLQKLRS